MVNDILEKAGIPFKATRFVKAPSTTYAIFTDSINRRGADAKNLLVDHHVYIELYTRTIDLVSEKKVEAQLDSRNIEYHKSERVWFEDEQVYQVIYDFNYIEKKGA